MKKTVTLLLIVIIIIGLFYSISTSQTINVKDYIKDKLPSIFSFYLSSLEELDLYEKEFIDLLQKLPEEEQEYYAKDVYKNGFSPELLKEVKDGKKVQIPTSNPPVTIIPQEKPMESLPSLIKRIKPSTVIIFAYDDKGKFLQLGSGFFISQNGDVITNYHVIQGASSAEIKTADGKTYPITYILAGDEPNDLIRLSVNIPSSSVYPLSLCQTIPEVGERIIVYGSPLGLENTVSDGIISAIRDIPDYGRIIQITAPISPGSSGSPVLNLQGEVIGIATFQLIEGQNLNFAIPSEKITSLILTEENKISITEEFFGPESKVKKVIPATDEAKIKSVINEFFWAISDKNWSKAKSYCVYGSREYDAVCWFEEMYDYMSSYADVVILDTSVDDILNVSIDGEYSKAYCYYSFTITVYDSDYERNINYGYLNLQKVGSSWKLISVGLQK
jgi:S1-C subfamily serine protease